MSQKIRVDLLLNNLSDLLKDLSLLVIGSLGGEVRGIYLGLSKPEVIAMIREHVRKLLSDENSFSIGERALLSLATYSNSELPITYSRINNGDIYFPTGREAEIGGLNYVEYLSPETEEHVYIYRPVIDAARLFGTAAIDYRNCLFTNNLLSKNDLDYLNHLLNNVAKRVGLFPSNVKDVEDIVKMLNILELPFSRDLLPTVLSILARAGDLDREHVLRLLDLVRRCIAVPVYGYVHYNVKNRLESHNLGLILPKIIPLGAVPHGEVMILDLGSDLVLVPCRIGLAEADYYLIVPSSLARESMLYPYLASENVLEQLVKAVNHVREGDRIFMAVSARRYKKYLEDLINRGLKYLEENIPIVIIYPKFSGSLIRIVPAGEIICQEQLFATPYGIEKLNVRTLAPSRREVWWGRAPCLVLI